MTKKRLKNTTFRQAQAPRPSHRPATASALRFGALGFCLLRLASLRMCLVQRLMLHVMLGDSRSLSECWLNGPSVIKLFKISYEQSLLFAAQACWAVLASDWALQPLPDNAMDDQTCCFS